MELIDIYKQLYKIYKLSSGYSITDVYLDLDQLSLIDIHTISGLAISVIESKITQDSPEEIEKWKAHIESIL